jgi:LCCL domain
VEIASLLVGVIVLLAVALGVVSLVCLIVVLVKALQNDQIALGIIGLFVPLVLFIVGWVKVKEWRLLGTMITWTLTAILLPVLAFAAILIIVGAGLREGAGSRWGMPQVSAAMSPEAAAPNAEGVRPDPGTLVGFRNMTGQVFYFDVRGSTTGTVYGNGVYTDDSSLATAAVHAGVLRDGERGVVQVTILGGRDSYPSTTRNGVTSNRWGSWVGSYQVEAVPNVRAPEAGRDAPGVEAGGRDVRADPGTLLGYRDQIGQAFYFDVVGSTTGQAWGTNVYSDDSTLAVAAVHAGALKKDERGIVKVTIMPGQDSYRGTSRHGVTTDSYRAWGGSYRVERAR